MSERRLPRPWLVGLILAVILATAVIANADRLGFGDDPSLGASGPISPIVW